MGGLDRARLEAALSGEAGRAGVLWLLRGRPARQALRAALQGLLPKAERLGPCRLLRAKYKPGRKLSAYYQVQLGTGARAIAVTWTPTTAVNADLAADLSSLDEARQRGLAAPFRQLTAAVAGWGLCVRVFPLDANFPALVRLADPEYVRPLLAAADAPALQCAVTVLRYRPGQRHVLRYAPVSGTGAGAVFAKLYENEAEAGRVFNISRQIQGWLASQTEALTAADPLAYWGQDAAVLYPRVGGAPLSWRWRRPGAMAEALTRFGAGLRLLHGAPEALAAGAAPYSLATEIKAIARASEHLSAWLPHNGQPLTALLDQAQALEARWPAVAPTFVHGDLKADHLWLTGSRLTLIDFDSCRLADPALDVGKFLADLRWWHTTMGWPGLAAAQARFLAGYGLAAHEPAWRRAHLYEALILLKIAARRVRLFDADWEAQTTYWLSRATTLFARLAR